MAAPAHRGRQSFEKPRYIRDRSLHAGAGQSDRKLGGRGAMHRVFEFIARALALLGGFVLIGLILITVASISGRALSTLAYNQFVQSNLGFLSDMLIASGIGPLNGDFEMVEMGIAFAIFCFLPWCQFSNGHASVDLFTSALPDRGNRFLVFLWEILLAVVIIVIAWRLGVGMSDKMQNGETTFLLQWPVWYGFAASFGASIAASLVAIYVAIIRGAELWTGRDLLIVSTGAAE